MRATTINALSFALILGSSIGSVSCAQVFDIGQTTLVETAGAGGTGGSGGIGGDGQGGGGQGGGGQGGATAACSEPLSSVCIDTTLPLSPPYDDPEWSCLGQDSGGGGSPDNPPAFVTFTIDTLTDLSSGAPLAGIHVKSCRAINSDCPTPFHETVSTDTGKVVLQLPYADSMGQYFISFKSDTTFPVVLYFANQFAKDFELKNYSLNSQDAFKSLFKGLKTFSNQPVAYDETRGHLDLASFDCVGNGSDIKFVLDQVTCEGDYLDCSSAQYYTTDNKASSSTQPTTGKLGSGGILNVKPGKVNVGAVAANLDPQGQVTFSTVSDVLISAGVLTSVLLTVNR